MRMALVTHERLVEHRPGEYHPERPARLGAVLAGVDDLHLDTDLLKVEAVPAPPGSLRRVHHEALIGLLEQVDRSGGGHLDEDTAMSEASWEAAGLAAGAGLVAVELLDRGEAAAAFCAVRPPGHHATPVRSMGFCLLNNVAVTAAALADRGERVLIVDIDAHHGNGTQDVFYADPRVMFVSFHQSPLYPGTGALTDRGSGEGWGATLNIPLPPGATGDVYHAAWDLLVAPVVEQFAPTWLLLSAGFDAHRDDPITDLGLAAGDYSSLTATIAAVVPPGRRVAFLEGGYDLAALRAGTSAMVAALVGEHHVTEASTSGGAGHHLLPGFAERLRAEPS